MLAPFPFCSEEKTKELSREVTEGREKSRGVWELTQYISLLTNAYLNVCSCKIDQVMRKWIQHILICFQDVVMEVTVG